MLTEAEEAHVPTWCVCDLNYLPIFSHHQCSKEKSPLSQYTSVKFILTYFHPSVIPEDDCWSECKIISLCKVFTSNMWVLLIIYVMVCYLILSILVMTRAIWICCWHVHILFYSVVQHCPVLQIAQKKRALNVSADS